MFGLRDRDVGVEHPAVRVGEERGAREVVDAHLGAARRQAGAGDQRPQHRRLVGGHPPHRHRRRRGRPAAVRAACPACGTPVRTAGLRARGVRGRAWWAGRGRSRPAAGRLLGRALRALVARLVSVQLSVWVRLMPSGMVAAAKPASWTRSSRSGAKPARRMEASRRRPNSAIRRGLGDGDARDGVGPDQRVAGGELGVQAAGAGQARAVLGAGLHPGPGPELLRPCRRPTRRSGSAGRRRTGPGSGTPTISERRSPGSVGRQHRCQRADAPRPWRAA